MTAIANSTLTTTFDNFRIRVNEAVTRLNSLSLLDSTLTLSGNATFATDVVVVDTTDKMLGVRIAAPVHPLHVAGNTLIGSTLWVNDATGLVGVGNTAPTHSLEVQGTTRISGAANVASTLRVEGVLTADANVAVGGELTTTGATAFSNTVSVVGKVTGTQLHLNSPVTDLVILNDAVIGANNTISLSVENTSGDLFSWYSGANNASLGTVGATERMTLSTDALAVSGNVDSTNDVNVARNVNVSGEVLVTSDARVKSEIEDINNGLEMICNLHPVSYLKHEADYMNFGLIAQEVREIIPTIVRGNDSQGFSLSYIDLIAILIEAMQEINERLEKLEDGNRNRVRGNKVPRRKPADHSS